ncbi:MAG: alpha/beta fold hydrolase [Denitromonas halophila]|nr:MAG: alpha/beta fold hydrolase [Denitromonas halophila]TVT65258.1 MAG: alpha/beta fold hydrolase [Denitromonas halophila]
MPSTPSAPPDPWSVFSLDVGDGHQLHIEQSGAPNGLPVICLHGGPGSGMSAGHRQFFDAARYHIVQFDQRGCGRSTPRGGLTHNTTAHLVADIERIRLHLGIDRWLVFGGSWGATLAMAYGAAHLGTCLGVILRGVFLGSADDLRRFFDDGHHHAPAIHARLAALAPPGARSKLAHWLPAALLAARPAEQATLTTAWMAWENALDNGPTAAFTPPTGDALAAAIDKYRVQAHYLHHGCFLEDGWWRDAVTTLAGRPVAILHGTQDRICHPDNARAVHTACPGSVLQLVDGCCHSPFAPAMAAALGGATRQFAEHGGFA